MAFDSNTIVERIDEILGSYLKFRERHASEGTVDGYAQLVSMRAALERLAPRDLEGHLRKLAAKHGVATTRGDGSPKKAELLNQELVSTANAYPLGDQKQVTAWLDIRNNAAHGHYEKYEAAQVGLMIDGVQAFIARLPA